MTLSSLSAQDPEMQMNLQHALGKPNIIRPKPGDLVLLCAQRVSNSFICCVLPIQHVKCVFFVFCMFNSIERRLMKVSVLIENYYMSASLCCRV